MNCAVCGGGPSRKKLRKDEVEIWECPVCGLAYWRPPSDFRLEATYDAAYFADPTADHGYDDYAALETSLRRTFARRLARLPRPQPDARLLDVGAAYGFAVTEAERAGWLAFGLEVSPAAASRAAEVTGRKLAVASLLAAPFPSATFDVVTMWDVLEHLADPHAAIREAARMLSPGGRLVLTTGDVGSLLARVSRSRWHLYTIPEHLFFYTRRSLELLLDANGLRVESIRADGSVYTLGYLVERVRKTLLGRGAGRPGTWPGAKLCLSVNLFDIVTVSAVLVGGE